MVLTRYFNKIKNIIPSLKQNSKKTFVFHNEKVYQQSLVDHYKDIVPVTIRYHDCMQKYRQQKKNE